MQLVSLQNFGSSNSYGRQLRQLRGRIASSRFKVTLKATFSTLIVNGKHSVFQVSASLKATGTSALKLVGILVALKTTADRNVNSCFDRILVAPKSYLVHSDSSREAQCLPGFCLRRKATGTFTLKAFKAMIDSNVNSSSIVCEVNQTAFFFVKHILNLK